MSTQTLNKAVAAALRDWLGQTPGEEDVQDFINLLGQQGYAIVKVHALRAPDFHAASPDDK